MRAVLDKFVESLYPGYFALVMATGIVSSAFYLLEIEPIALTLLVIALIAYPVLILATAARAVLHPGRLWSDLINPRSVFASFTFVAASDVLGLQLFNRGWENVAIGLWLVALVAWFMLSYFSFSVLMLVNSDVGVDVVHGGWLIAIVGTQSLALLGATVAPELGPFRDTAFVGVYVFWSVGIVLYGIFMTLFSYRVFFFRVTPQDMTPLVWVVMGAAAISVNAGSLLILTESGIDFLEQMEPYIDGVTLVLWAWATWLIPLLVLIGIWRHVIHKQPLVYEPLYWSLVFPLGMYTVASLRLSLASDFTLLHDVAEVMVWIALIAWLTTFIGMLRASCRAMTAVLAEKTVKR